MQTASYAEWRERLTDGINTDFYPIAYVEDRLANGDAWFAATDAAAVVFEIKTFPSGLRVLHFLVGAGDLTELVSRIRPQLEAWGKAQGCKGALMESRDGWTRALRPHGYEAFQTSLYKAF